MGDPRPRGLHRRMLRAVQVHDIGVGPAGRHRRHRVGVPVVALHAAAAGRGVLGGPGVGQAATAGGPTCEGVPGHAAAPLPALPDSGAAALEGADAAFVASAAERLVEGARDIRAAPEAEGTRALGLMPLASREFGRGAYPAGTRPTGGVPGFGPMAQPRHPVEGLPCSAFRTARSVAGRWCSRSGWRRPKAEKTPGGGGTTPSPMPRLAGPARNLRRAGPDDGHRQARRGRPVGAHPPVRRLAGCQIGHAGRADHRALVHAGAAHADAAGAHVPGHRARGALGRLSRGAAVACAKMSPGALARSPSRQAPGPRRPMSADCPGRFRTARRRGSG